MWAFLFLLSYTQEYAVLFTPHSSQKIPGRFVYNTCRAKYTSIWHRTWNGVVSILGKKRNGVIMAPRSILRDAEIAFIHSQRVARLATSDADGHPHVVPVCFAFDGSRFYIALDEKPKRVEQRHL